MSIEDVLQIIEAFVIVVAIIFYIKRFGKSKGGIIIFAAIILATVGLFIFMKFQHFAPKNFEMQDENRYIICTQDGSYIQLYRVDLENNLIISQLFEINKEEVSEIEKYEQDWNEFNNIKIKITEEQNEKIKNIIKKLKKDDKSKTPTTIEEKTNLREKGIYKYYEIKDYKSNIYYVKDEDSIKQMKKILNESN